MGKLDGKIALVTGSSEGIGFAIATHFLIEGAAHVFINGRRQDVLDEAVKQLDNKNVTAIVGDISNMADLDKIYSVIQTEKGHLDILVTNAATFHLASLEDITEEHYDNVFDVNVKGTLFTVQKALPVLVDGASIIVLGSTAGVKGNAKLSVYSAAKAALRSFVRCWTVDLKERKIRVNLLAPGPIDTPALRNVYKDPEQKKEFYNSQAALTVLNRVGTADEVAKPAVFLASNDSSYITGIELFVDGGFAQI